MEDLDHMRSLGSAFGHLLLGVVTLGIGLGNASAQEERSVPERPIPQPGQGAETSEGTVSAPELHVVESGDTLWDLCAKQMNSPWYWPKIWSYNPQITNPHWIYPGNELRFYPSDENLPTNVQVSQAMTIDEPEPDDSGDRVRTVGTLEVGRVAPGSVYTSFIGFVSANDHNRSGQITNSERESVMLSDFDRAYIKFKSTPRKGDNLAVYRTIREIVHPVSGESMGYAVEILGGMSVVDVGSEVSTGQISQAYRPIERYDFVGPWPERLGSRVDPQPNTQEVKGYIVETVGDVISEIGEHQLVFIDRGTTDGVKRGNTFSVVARGDGYTRETEGLPNEDVGEVMVIDAQEKSSTGIVTYALRELSVGDKLEMRP